MTDQEATLLDVVRAYNKALKAQEPPLSPDAVYWRDLAYRAARERLRLQK